MNNPSLTTVTAVEPASSGHRHNRVARIGLATLAIGLIGLSACGSDDAADTTTSTTEADAGTSQAVDDVAHGHDDDAPNVSIGLVDYSFEDVPRTVAAGTPLSITNSSTTELHELVAVRLPDDDTRTAEELVALPPAELGALIGAGPAAVIIAPPGEAGRPVVGDGTLSEPGRYLLLCSIPVGADPAEYLAAAQTSAGPPQVAGGPPHFTVGMFAELEVE
ncbi:MAG: hypothetical protein ACYC2O_05895 [Microthrixaceae bacterium]